MKSEPKNYTRISGLDGTGQLKKIVTVYYSNYDNYDYLPGAAKSPQIKEEYDKWWKWFREERFKLRRRRI